MKRAVLLLITIFSIAAIAQTPDLPPPPAGYVWINCVETKSAFLKPDGWFFKKVGKDSGNWGYFISKENIDELGSFTTGLSVNILKKVASKSGVPAPAYAAALIDEMKKTHKVLTESGPKKLGPFHQFGVRTLNPDPQNGSFINHIVAIGNEETGTVYILTFEAPSDSWDAAWKIGEPIMKKFLIDTDI